VKRLLLLASVCGALLASVAPGAVAATCAGDNRGKCLVRPHQLYTGAHTWIRGIKWKTWTRSTALGYGKIVESSLYASFVLPAKVRLRLPAECEGREWFWSTTIKWGKNYGRPYLRGDELTPCE